MTRHESHIIYQGVPANIYWRRIDEARHDAWVARMYQAALVTLAIVGTAVGLIAAWSVGAI